jgi:hypothetical protein
MNNGAAAPQLPPRNVDLEISEAEVQELPPFARRMLRLR